MKELLTFGQGAVNNIIGWGQAPSNSKKITDFGLSCFTSYSGITNITGTSAIPKPPIKK